MPYPDVDPTQIQWRIYSYLEVWDELLAHSHAGRPLLVGIDGHSGSGKTTLATGLAALDRGTAVVHIDDLVAGHLHLDRDLTRYDLIILVWNNALTTEYLSDSQEDHLLAAVEGGTGIAAWHGAAAAFRSSLRYHLMLGATYWPTLPARAPRSPTTSTSSTTTTRSLRASTIFRWLPSSTT